MAQECLNYGRFLVRSIANNYHFGGVDVGVHANRRDEAKRQCVFVRDKDCTILDVLSRERHDLAVGIIYRRRVKLVVRFARVWRSK